MRHRVRCCNSLDFPPVAPGTARPGPLGLALSAALLALLLPGRASAQNTQIDDFTVGQPRVSSTANGVESASVSAGLESSIIGGERDIAVRRLGGAADASIDVFPDPGTLTYSTGGGGTFGQATIIWDGDDNAGGTGNIDFDGLRTSANAPVDLTFGGLTDQLDIKTASGDTLNLTVRITLYANAGTSATLERTQPNGNQTLSFRFSDFTITGDPTAFDITDVGAIRLDLITATAAAGLDVDVDFVRTSATVTVTMVDQVLDSAGNPKTGPAVPGDTIRYTVTIENPDDPGGLASTPLAFTFDPLLPPTSGLTTLVPGSVNVPNAAGVGATVVEGNGAGDDRVRINLTAIPDRAAGGACGGANTVAGCVSFTFDVVVGDTLPANLLRVIGGQTFIPAQGTLTNLVQTGISTTLRTNDPDVQDPPRSDDPPRENLTQVAICGNGNLEAAEGCDDGNTTDGDGCNASCLIESIEDVGDCLIGDCTPPPADCTPGAANCPRCNDAAPGLTDGASCASGFCSEVGGIAVCTDCGNGQVEDREGCDNPGRVDNAECTASCQVTSCPTGTDCDQTCTITPGAPSDPTCHTCTVDEQCVSQDCQGNEDGTGICVGLPVCGNGTLEYTEGCDDGNTADGDGCSSTCHIESIEVIGDCRLGDCPPPVSCAPGSPDCPACNTTFPGQTGDASCESGFCNADGFCQDCGDGNLDRFEGCDDMNDTGADGCSATCLIESCPEGQSCPPAPDCTPGSPSCNTCNTDPDGATGDASCESDYCDPGTNTCGPRPPRLGGGGCAATTADAGVGLGLMLVLCLCWRRRRSAAGAIALLVAAIALPQVARAQEDDARNFSAERFKISSDRDGILDVESGTVIGHLNWDLGFWLGYADDPLALYMEDGDERIDPFLTRRIGGELVAAVGFGRRLQLGVQIPVILDQNYSYMDAALEPESTAGLGDVSIHPKLQVLFTRSHGVDLAIIPAFTVPSRGSESYFGDVTLTFAPMIALSRRIDRIGLGANFGYRLRANTPEVLGLRVVDEAFARLGASYRLNSDAEKPLDVGLSVDLSTAAADFFGIFNRNYAETLLGANYQVTSDWNLFGGGGVGLNPGFGTPDWRVLAGLRFTKRPIVCEAPLVARNGRCVKDCPAPYVERDGECVLPACPAGFERVGEECVLQVGCDGNPPNKDADCDTLPAPPWIQLGPPDDPYDKNRTEPRKPGEPVDPTGYKFGDTVPVEEGKTDFPESVTEYDYCPTVPGKVEHHGCPPPSVVASECTAGSGRGAITVGPEILFLPDAPVLTLPSRVPLEELARVVARDPGLLVAINVGGPRANQELAQLRAEAVAAFLKKNGINVDNVSVVGTGAPASAGADTPANYPVTFERRCPDELPPTTLCKELELGDDYKIEYEVNSDVLRPASKEMLKRDVLWILAAHPKVRVEIQGHTSSEGRLQYNMDLSLRRARAVVNYLVSEGIAADRLVAVGHGPKIPLVSPERTEADREKNRRIEFNIRPRKECNTCTRFEVGKIQFEFNSGVIKPESFPELDSVARKLLANPEVHLLIEGHTSSEGAANYNRRLSGTRAAAVRKYLIDKGVAQNRLESKGVGEDKLLIPDDKTEEQREINRRVEFTITKGKPECPE
jgi:cysteine-rich repeat protein